MKKNKNILFFGVALLAALLLCVSCRPDDEGGSNGGDAWTESTPKIVPRF